MITLSREAIGLLVNLARDEKERVQSGQACYGPTEDLAVIEIADEAIVALQEMAKVAA
jgi:hypothetical protein